MTGYYSRLRSPNLEKAACIGVNPEIFFAEDQVSPDFEMVEEARLVCASCAEQKECLGYGLRSENYGMWGGLTANERRNYLRGDFRKLQQAIDLELI
jgi:WhiB family redox-sensing transcriptional regulator